jgi:poly(hydroxyalkanoate) depolymerase family esterase
MKISRTSDLLEATRLTSAGRLTEATAVLQRMLGGLMAADGTNSQDPRSPLTIDGVVETAAKGDAKPTPQAEPMPGPSVGQLSFSVLRRALQPTRSGVLGGFLDQISCAAFRSPRGGLADLPSNPACIAAPNGAQFLDATFSSQAGSRPYKLYVPSGYRAGQPIPLIVMLHGCTQSPDDFATGTRMNEVAEEQTCLVAYPGQTSSANMQKCWNWFSEADQQRDRGEPSLIAGITRQIMCDYTIDAGRVYVAGLSAGGAAAAILGDAYPDLYAAIGVHSGLACGAARDMPSAFSAMKRGSGGSAHQATDTSQSETPRRIVPAVVFHGDQDTTVNPRNGEAVVAQSAQARAFKTQAEKGQVPDGHAYSRTLHTDATGRTVIEQWVIHGAGHAWSGGSLTGSYTDPRGPDASREMLRFFMEHPHSTARQAH